MVPLRLVTLEGPVERERLGDRSADALEAVQSVVGKGEMVGHAGEDLDAAGLGVAAGVETVIAPGEHHLGRPEGDGRAQLIGAGAGVVIETHRCAPDVERRVVARSPDVLVGGAGAGVAPDRPGEAIGPHAEREALHVRGGR